MKELSILKTSALIDEKSLFFLNEIKKRIGRRNFSLMLNSIFVEVVMKYAKLNKPVLRKTVKYQDKEKCLKLFHYSIDPDVYEACLDARKANKVSVSFLLNEAIRELISASSKKMIVKFQDCISSFISFIKKLDNYHVICNIYIDYEGKNLVQTIKLQIQLT